MKSFFAACLLSIVAGSSYGQTNTITVSKRSALHVPTAASTNAVVAPVVPIQKTLSHESEVQPADIGLYRRFKEQAFYTKSMSPTWTSTESIFRSDNDQMGDSCIRDTYLTIFPSGR
jgi:hypothetical protein